MSEISTEICSECGIEFGMPARFKAVCRSDSKKIFFCPNGHGQHYTESEADNLRRERDRLKQDAARLNDVIRHEREAREAAERSARAMRGVATRMKNRIKAGVCPCCNRTFQDLARHMASKHPDIDNVIPLHGESANAQY